MVKFSGILLCTDLDGTLIRNDGTISKENINAIEYFKKEGGIFTFITGRMPFYAEAIHDIVNPNAPIGCINGGGVFDYAKKEYIWKQVMPKNVVEIIRAVDEKFADIGIQVNTFYKCYFCRENQTTKWFREVTDLPNLVCDYYKVDEPIAKIIFGSEIDEQILDIQKTLLSHPLAENFDFVRSERTLFEILPKGICKGTAVKKLAEHLNIDMNKTIAIGDYNNDISMFRAVKIGIAVANACEDALAAADCVTVSNDKHAIAQVIYDLENGKYVL